ncbi:MAG: MerR family transcriptional regulator [Clostridia bacterium]|nr:MerR family transcriptional regulator [Clostridia bacterium]
MEDKHLYDITEVCRMLGTTSRTLRFYEEKKIITSTTVGLSARRKYTEEQLLQIKNVLVLRSLGLSVKSITELQKEQSDLKNAVLSKRAEIYASIEAHIKEINLLNEAVYALELGKNIFDGVWQSRSDADFKELEIARLCTDAIISNDDEFLYRHLSSRLLQYMPKDVYSVARTDTLATLGDFLGIDEIAADKKYSNKIFSKVRYSKLGLMITFVFHAGKIDGLWLGYYDSTRR